MSSDMSRRAQESVTIGQRQNEIYRALAATSRRVLLSELMDVTEGTSLTLPDAVMTPAHTLTSEELQRQLYHTHLPLLADLGYVRWTTDPLRARRGPKFEEIATVLGTRHSATQVSNN